MQVDAEEREVVVVTRPYVVALYMSTVKVERMRDNIFCHASSEDTNAALTAMRKSVTRFYLLVYRDVDHVIFDGLGARYVKVDESTDRGYVISQGNDMPNSLEPPVLAAFVANLLALPRLVNLKLSGFNLTEIADAFLAAVRDAPRLEILDVRGCFVDALLAYRLTDVINMHATLRTVRGGWIQDVDEVTYNRIKSCFTSREKPRTILNWSSEGKWRDPAWTSAIIREMPRARLLRNLEARLACGTPMTTLEFRGVDLAGKPLDFLTRISAVKTLRFFGCGIGDDREESGEPAAKRVQK